MDAMHNLLKRQLKRHMGVHFSIPAEWRTFLNGVNEAYQSSDADRAMLERSLELSSQELLDANLEMRAVFQAIPDLVFRLDHEGTILDVKAGVSGALMIARRDLIGKRLQDTPLKDAAPQFAAAIQRVVAENTAVTIEYSGVRQGEESDYEARLVPLPEKQMVVIIRNITERKQSLRLLGAAVEQSTESITITDTELDLPGPKILFVNPAFTQMTGYAAAEVLGRTPRILQGPKSDRTVMRRMHDTLGRGETFKGETVNYRKDGTEFNLEWEVTPIRNSSGNITHFLGVQRDISERKRAELELERAHTQLLAVSRQAGMAEFATGILHNVGNVLNSVNVASGCVADSLRRSKSANLSKVVALLREHEKDLGDFFTHNPKGRQVPLYLAHLAEDLAGEQAGALKELAELQKNIGHISDIVTTQQGMAKASEGTVAVNMTELVEDAVRMNLSAVARHNVAVILECADVPPVIADKTKTLQILVNLVRNAKQSCATSDEPDKKLTIRTTAGDGRARIAVCDNGVGIPPENLPRIFSHGFTTKKEGHGFGLYSAALAAGEMGGSLTVYSDGYGHGATFILELPCMPTLLLP